MERRDYQTNDKGIKVLILSDRLIKRARALAEDLQRTERVQVVGIAEDRQQALNIAKEHSFDYLIIAGYLRTERTYGVIAELREQKMKFLPVQWAILDSLISGFCRRYQIPLKFERTQPLEEFVEFLESHKKDLDLLVQQEN